MLWEAGWESGPVPLRKSLFRDFPNILAIGRRDDTARPHHRTSDRTMCYGALDRQSITRRGGASAGIGGVAGETSDGRIPAPSPPPAAAINTLLVLDAARDCLRRPPATPNSSEERRGGKVEVSTVQHRGPPYNSKNK